LYEQAGNDTYGASARDAIKEEVKARFQEVDRLAQAADFNGIKLLDGAGITQDVRLQVGTDSTVSSRIMLDKAIFGATGISSLGITGITTNFTTSTISNASTADLKLNTAAGAAAILKELDKAIDGIVTRQTKIGAAQNRLTSAVEAAQIQEINLTSANSQIKDADIAEESSNFVKYQILQQSSASLLTQANQTPSIALSLI
jgi:flagellin